MHLTCIYLVALFFTHRMELCEMSLRWFKKREMNKWTWIRDWTIYFCDDEAHAAATSAAAKAAK